MMAHDGEGRAAWIRQIRAIATPRARAKDDNPARSPERVQALEQRVAHLERLVEGLQDSVHRESERHAKLIAELQNQVDPAVMSAALADDARNRGL